MKADALRRRAMALGARLELDGNTFNAGRVQGRHIALLPKLPAVVAPPAPSAPNPLLDAVAQFTAATFLLQEGIAVQMAAMQKQIDLLTALVAAKPKGPKTYTINRVNGEMDSISINS